MEGHPWALHFKRLFTKKPIFNLYIPADETNPEPTFRLQVDLLSYGRLFIELPTCECGHDNHKLFSEKMLSLYGEL
jgi:hypothetical protein